MFFRKEGIMDRKDIIMMSQRESKRLHVIHKVLDEELKQVDAAGILDLSDRQIGRIVKRVREEGNGGITHKSRGRPSNRAIPKKVKGKVIRLYGEKYWDFGPTLASEKLYELDKIKVNHDTLRCWLIEEQKQDWQRKARPHRQWRQRKEHFGQMVQMDGSHHDWLEGRGPLLVLMGHIDDATNTVFGRFYDYEGTMPAMDSSRGYIERYGIPQSVYLDKHTTYKSPRKLTIEEELEGIRKPQSQFERAMDELGVEVIPANSPQAKGRIERLFGTLQDRLVKEMRLAGINGKEEANRFLEGYLPTFNRRFSIAPAKEVNFHREIPKEIDLDKIFSIRTKRVLRRDFTITYNKGLYQIEDTPPNTRIKRVMVEERINGRMYITYNGLNLKYKKIEVMPVKPKEERPVKLRKAYIPPPDHPWRSFKLPGSLRFEEKAKTLAGVTK